MGEQLASANSVEKVGLERLEFNNRVRTLSTLRSSVVYSGSQWSG